MLQRLRPDGTPLRTGFTTGANACAAACAAATVLAGRSLEPWLGPLPELTADLYGPAPAAVSITLPNGDPATFPVLRIAPQGSGIWASVIKDGGDDPDCTHRAEHWALVEPYSGGLVLDRGEGVGRVTKPGLGLDVGGPAINPVPRANILAEVRKIVPSARVTIGITHGVTLAAKTLNARLGILDGLSILGTTGIVYPYSTAAFRASVAQGIDVAHTLGAREIALTTGGRSEKFAMTELPHLPEPAFIQMGDFVGFALDHAAVRGMGRATICGMIGKLSKMADGRTMTHAAGSEVDTVLLADLACGIGASSPLAEAIRTANTGRHVQELVLAEPLPGFFDALCERVSIVLSAHLSARHPTPPEIHVVLCDFSGPALGRYPHAA